MNEICAHWTWDGTPINQKAQLIISFQKQAQTSVTGELFSCNFFFTEWIKKRFHMKLNKLYREQKNPAALWVNNADERIGN